MTKPVFPVGNQIGQAFPEEFFWKGIPSEVLLFSHFSGMIGSPDLMFFGQIRSRLGGN